MIGGWTQPYTGYATTSESSKLSLKSRLTMQSASLTGFGLLVLAIVYRTGNNRTNLVVLNDDSNNIGAPLGYSNGSFTQQIAILTSFSSSTNSIGNFNNNSRLICEYLFLYMPTIADFTVSF